MTFTYAEVGATAGVELPRGYNHLRVRVPLRTIDLGRAADAVVGWRMHRAAGARVDTDAPRATTGADVTVCLGVGRLRLRAPCRVVWTVDEPDRAGFAYGTVAGHPETGEESFLVERADDGRLWFAVTAFSRPGRWYTRAAGPAVPVLQRQYALHLGRVLDRLVP